MVQQSFSHSTTLPVPPSEAWSALQEPQTWASIGGVDNVADVRITPDGMLAGFSFSSTVAGRSYPGRASVDRAVPPTEMTLAIVTSELDGTIAVLVSPPHAPERLDVSLRVRSKSLVAGMMFPVIAGAIGNGFPQRVETFAAGLGDA